MQRKIVLVEDDDVIRQNYAEMLEYEGFTVQALRNKQEALEKFAEEFPDLAILDISLENDREGGFEICMYLRQHMPSLPVLFLTSHGSEVDKISGFRLGADDYLTKDVSFDYLLVRIEALLRRYEIIKSCSTQEGESESAQLLSNNKQLTLDDDRTLVFWNKTAVDITLTQYWIVKDLVKANGQARTYQQLMHAAQIYVEQNTITAHIKTIRNRFKVIDKDFNAIKSERGIGYRWISSIE